jgi:phosphoglycolate phosphatase-like HAD superfamily hydrolase
LINNYADKFSRLVKSKVIDSKWVPGVLEYLSNNYKTKNFFLITATPQEEIEDIVSKLDIKHMFKDVIGSPLNKEDAIERILKEYKLPYGNSVMIGDSISDYNGAKFNNVEFILRCTTTNISLQNKLNCRMIKDFL